MATINPTNPMESNQESALLSQVAMQKAQIAAQSRMQSAQIEAERDLATAQIDAQKENYASLREHQMMMAEQESMARQQEAAQNFVYSRSLNSQNAQIEEQLLQFRHNKQLELEQVALKAAMATGEEQAALAEETAKLKRDMELAEAAMARYSLQHQNAAQGWDTVAQSLQQEEIPKMMAQFAQLQQVASDVTQSAIDQIFSTKPQQIFSGIPYNYEDLEGTNFKSSLLTQTYTDDLNRAMQGFYYAGKMEQELFRRIAGQVGNSLGPTEVTGDGGPGAISDQVYRLLNGLSSYMDAAPADMTQARREASQAEVRDAMDRLMRMGLTGTEIKAIVMRTANAGESLRVSLQTGALTGETLTGVGGEGGRPVSSFAEGGGPQAWMERLKESEKDAINLLGQHLPGRLRFMWDGFGLDEYVEPIDRLGRLVAESTSQMKIPTFEETGLPESYRDDFEAMVGRLRFQQQNLATATAGMGEATAAQNRLSSLMGTNAGNQIRLGARQAQIQAGELDRLMSR